MKITSKGQVTIPQDIREKLGLLPETDVEFEIDGNTVRIRKASSGPGRRGDRVIANLKGRATSKLTTDEIMAMTRAAPKRKSK